MASIITMIVIPTTVGLHTKEIDLGQLRTIQYWLLRSISLECIRSAHLLTAVSENNFICHCL